MPGLKKRRIVKKHRDLEVKRIGSSGGLPLGIPAGQMPALGTRRSTSVFVPKTVAKVGDGDSAALVLRSGKRLVLSKPAGKKVEADGCKNEWMRLFGGCEDVSRFWKGGEAICQGNAWKEQVATQRRGGWAELESPGFGADCEDVREIASNKKFGIVYSRKRRRTLSYGTCSSSSQFDDKDVKDRRFGISFVRRKYKGSKSSSPFAVATVDRGEETIRHELAIKAKMVQPLVEDATRINVGRYEISEIARSFAEKAGVLGTDVWEESDDLKVVLVLISTSDCSSLQHFASFLVSTLAAIRRNRVKFLDFASFLLSKSIAKVFSKHGVHFLPVKWDSYMSCRTVISGAGFCGIAGCRMFRPMISLNFCALPFYFKSLHLSMFLGLKRTALCPVRQMTWQSKGRYSGNSHMDILIQRCASSQDEPWMEKLMANGTDIVMLESSDEKRNIENRNNEADHKVVIRQEALHPVGDLKLAVQNDAIHGMKIRRHQKKRTSLRSARVKSSSANAWRNVLSRIHKRILKVNSTVKVNSLPPKKVEPAFVEHIDSWSSDFPSARDDGAFSSPTSPRQDFRKSAHKSPIDLTKELKSTLMELKQNIESVRCRANILVIESDRCWREEGAEVMLEISDSNEWLLAIKINGSNRFTHKVQEMRPCVTNRYTHAMIWSGENGWKLEFSDRMDWLMFRELHRECSDRNSKEVTVKVIPVPGVRLIAGYDDIHSIFVRPDFYISTQYDEVERVLLSENSIYDMDSGDEEWLRHTNSKCPVGESGSTTHLSVDNFEKIIFAFEKVAYNNTNDANDSEKAINHCLDFAKKDILAAVFGYWLKKKQQRQAALLRVFQEPTQKTTVTQKPFLRKKRSFKRQGSHTGRGKPDYYLQVGAIKEELRRVREAESAANKAVELAIQLRNRVQILMANADLATYKASIALRLAEAIQESTSPDLASSILG